MVKEFFDIRSDSAMLFKGLEIMNGEYAHEINTRPVLSFTFKDSKDDPPLLIRQIKTALEPEFEQYAPIVYDGLTKSQRGNLEEIQNALAAKGDTQWEPLWNAIAFLSKIVSEHYKRSVIILIDEYDTPMSAAHANGCYEQLRPFFSSLYGTSL